MLKPSDVQPPDMESSLKMSLKNMAFSGSLQGYAAAHYVEHISCQDGRWVVVIRLEQDQRFLKDEIQQAVERGLKEAWPNLPIRVILTQERSQASARLSKTSPIPGVKRVIVVGSGKGGVGKSTTAVHLAYGLQRLGWRVGLLDADIYGPSLHKMLKTDQKVHTQDKRLLPLDIHGVWVMSLGFLVSEDKPAVWRGPMVHHALRQMIFDVAWPELDCLVMDLPPGTGDASLTIAQNVVLDGAVIVSTPQEISLIDARKAMAMFRLVHVPLLGLVENMSEFQCPQCHHVSSIFHHAGVAAEAERQQVPFLGSIPLHPHLGQAGEIGNPLILEEPNHPISLAYTQVSHLIREKIMGCVHF